MTQKQALEELRKLDCIWIDCKTAATVSGFSENGLRQQARKRWEQGKFYEPYRIDVTDRGVRIHLADFIAFNETKKRLVKAETFTSQRKKAGARLPTEIITQCEKITRD